MRVILLSVLVISLALPQNGQGWAHDAQAPAEQQEAPTDTQKDIKTKIKEAFKKPWVQAVTAVGSLITLTGIGTLGGVLYHRYKLGQSQSHSSQDSSKQSVGDNSSDKADLSLVLVNSSGSAPLGPIQPSINLKDSNNKTFSMDWMVVPFDDMWTNIKQAYKGVKGKSKTHNKKVGNNDEPLKLITHTNSGPEIKSIEEISAGSESVKPAFELFKKFQRSKSGSYKVRTDEFANLKLPLAWESIVIGAEEINARIQKWRTGSGGQNAIAWSQLKRIVNKFDNPQSKGRGATGRQQELAWFEEIVKKDAWETFWNQSKLYKDWLKNSRNPADPKEIHDLFILHNFFKQQANKDKESIKDKQRIIENYNVLRLLHPVYRFGLLLEDVEQAYKNTENTPQAKAYRGILGNFVQALKKNDYGVINSLWPTYEQAIQGIGIEARSDLTRKLSLAVNALDQSAKFLGLNSSTQIEDGTLFLQKLELTEKTLLPSLQDSSKIVPEDTQGLSKLEVSEDEELYTPEELLDEARQVITEEDRKQEIKSACDLLITKYFFEENEEERKNILENFMRILLLNCNEFERLKISNQSQPTITTFRGTLLDQEAGDEMIKKHLEKKLKAQLDEIKKVKEPGQNRKPLPLEYIKWLEDWPSLIFEEWKELRNMGPWKDDMEDLKKGSVLSITPAPQESVLLESQK